MAQPTDSASEQDPLRFRLVELCARGQEQFHIEYGHGIGLANHLLHGLVALDALHAPVERLHTFYDAYSNHSIGEWQLEPAVRREGPLTEDILPSLLGANQRFLDLVDFFQAAIEQRGRVPVVAQYLPRLASGFWVAAFHPMIHLGFGFLLRESELGVAQGLAYLWFTHKEHSSISDAPAAHSSDATEPAAILADIARDARLDNAVDRQASMFSGRMESLRNNQIVHQYVFQWRDLFAIDVADPDASGRIDGVMNTLLDLAVRAHYGTGANDFFLVHLVTSAFACFTILRECGEALSVAQRLEIVKHYWTLFVLAYIVQHRKRIEPFVAPADEEKDWDNVLQQARACDEEHVIKLAMCCWWFVSHSLVDADLCYYTAQKVVTTIHKGSDYTY